MPPTPQDAARRLLILVGISSHALRLMMVWDFVFRTRSTLQNLTGKSPDWDSLRFRGELLKVRAKWNWFWERRAIRKAFRRANLTPSLTSVERDFLQLGLSESSKAKACELLWQIEAAACIAWAIRILPRLWPMDQAFDGKFDFSLLAGPEYHLVETANLRPFEEIRTAAECVKHWHWRGRQLQLHRHGYVWPPANATREQIADLQSKGLSTLDGIVRFTATLLHNQGKLDDIMDEDFVAKGKPFRELSQDELSELLGFISERQKALNWLCGLAPNNDWDSVPTET